MTTSTNETPGLYGVYAVNKLVGSAQLDRRLTPSDRGVLAIVSGYSDGEGTCCVSISSTLSERTGTSRQFIQKSLRKLEACGYLASERRYDSRGGERSKSYRFNMTLEGADACPVVWNDRASDDTLSPLEVGKAKGVQPPDVAGECNRQRLRGVQPPEVAHKKPPEETSIEETSACSGRPLRTERRSREGGQDNAGHSRDLRSRQQPLLLPIPGGSATAPPGDRMKRRVDAFCRNQRMEVAGRIMTAWFRLDGEDLVAFLGDGFETILERAITAEIKRRGNGVRYIAGAVERATNSRVSVTEIMAGQYRPPKEKIAGVGPHRGGGSNL